MNCDSTILIADRNSHIRMFLMREMMAEGYRVKLASTSEIILQIVFTPGAVDLLIIDPDLTGMELSNFLNVLGERIPPLPIVFHTHQRYPDANDLIEKIPFCTVIEKEGDSVEQIKVAVGKLLTTSGMSAKERGHSLCRERTTPRLTNGRSINDSGSIRMK